MSLVSNLTFFDLLKHQDQLISKKHIEYQSLVGRGKMRQAEMDSLIAPMKNIRDILQVCSMQKQKYLQLEAAVASVMSTKKEA
ncbi:MAG: hypothetical protein COC24_019310 [Alphaproteobacteria bacterium]|nr:hypothetical protein [Alphaproteobacteria bacterium]